MKIGFSAHRQQQYIRTIYNVYTLVDLRSLETLTVCLLAVDCVQCEPLSGRAFT